MVVTSRGTTLRGESRQGPREPIPWVRLPEKRGASIGRSPVRNLSFSSHAANSAESKEPVSSIVSTEPRLREIQGTFKVRPRTNSENRRTPRVLHQCRLLAPNLFVGRHSSVKRGKPNSRVVQEVRK